MKKLLPLVFLFLYSINSTGQTLDYRTRLNTAVDFYNANAIQNKLLDENIVKAFNNVVFSGSDLVSNSSAFGYSQNEEKTTISAATNFRLGKELSPAYLKFGTNASGSNNIFEFYSEDTWKNNVSLNLGLIFRLGKSSLFYSENESNKDLLKSRRKIHAGEPLYNGNKYSLNILNEILNIKKDLLEMTNRDILVNRYSELLKEMVDVKKLVESGKYESAYTLLNSEEKKIQKYLEAFKSQIELDKYIEDDILYNFDKNNDVTYGYSLKWIDVNLNLGNSTYKFSESNISEEILEEFTNTIGLNNDINKLKSVYSLNLNHTRNGTNTIWYYQLGFSATSSSFLENPLINGKPKIIQGTDLGYTIIDKDGQELGEFNSIEDKFETGALNGYGAIFFTKAKNVGFNLTWSHNYLIDKPDGTFFQNNFTTLFGPIFRKEKDDQTSLTFGIDIGWQNALYNTRINDDFVARIRIGIPFTIYSNKKSKKE